MGEELKTETKLVPEADLLAIKAKAGKDASELQTQIATLQSKADSHYTNYLSEQAAKDKLAVELAELKKETEQLRPVKGLKEQAEAKVKELEKLLLDVSRKRLIQVYKIPDDKLQGKTLAELSAIEEALRLVGREAGRFDLAGTGVGAGTEKMSAREKLVAGFTQLRK